MITFVKSSQSVVVQALHDSNTAARNADFSNGSASKRISGTADADGTSAAGAAAAASPVSADDTVADVFVGLQHLDIDPSSYDGTWMTRGHKSHYAVGFVH